jgi:hypothetical protein
MSEVVSFRPDDDEAAAIERVRRREGFSSRAEAVRYLVRRGAESIGPLSDEPVFRFRVPAAFRGGRSLSSREIDDAVYGDR